MTAGTGRWGRAHALARLAVATLLLALAQGSALAVDKLNLFVTSEAGFGRLVFSFPERLDLPAYDVSYENGVLAVEFEDEVDAVLPDVGATLPGYVTIARVDPDRRGIRFGLRTTLNINHIEAGERLFVDLMPEGWQGLPPGLPADVVANLARRAEAAAVVAEQKRKAEQALALQPTAEIRVGRNPTFVRLQFAWSTPTQADFVIEGDMVNLDFGWPVPIDLYAIKADLPAEIVAVENSVSADGSRVAFTMAEGVTPRFYEISPTDFVIDIDTELAEPAETVDLTAAALAGPSDPVPEEPAGPVTTMTEGPAADVVPYVTSVGETLRLVFPFESDVAAAVFRRGDSVWMLFDTAAAISEPRNLDMLVPAAGGFSVLRTGETQVVRLDLTAQRLATLGTEGRSWVLSLGDVLLSPTEPIQLNRRRDALTQLEMTADLSQPGNVHRFRDPLAGDVLTVVTVFPPARGVMRSLDFVDFTALASIHGLVVRPKSDGLAVDLEGALAVIHREGEGLALSAADQARGLLAGTDAAKRSGYLNLAALDEEDPRVFLEEETARLAKAAESEQAALARARLDLAQFYVANRFAHEALGVLAVLETTLEDNAMKQRARLTRAVADILAHRPEEAIDILTAPAFLEDPDAVMWRSIARAGSGDYRGARLDAMASEVVLDSYPLWVRQAFLLGATRSALETGDTHLARRYLGLIDFARLDPEQLSIYRLHTARLAEAENRVAEALDTYGQVIAADIRPTRAEAVYRTLLLLDQGEGVDLTRATETLAAEAMLWRGDALEAKMQELLATLYFRSGDYRSGFETVQQAVQFNPETPASDAMTEAAQEAFAELYLDGRADALDAVEALTLFYDYRQLTPPGTRGDEMIRNLARRLVQVDLLQQAGDLLEYQIDNRLKGAAQAQIAAELAAIRIASRNPEAALNVLNRTRLADLSPGLERQRRILEARALIDAGRQELAIDLLSSLSGRDVDLLRIDGLWRAGRYADASELIETTYGGDPADLLNQPARTSIVRAAVGFVLANDRLGLSRLRSKFGERMATTPEWAMFDFVTSTITTTSTEFRAVAREVAGLDSLNAFLASYRATYGANGLAPGEAAPAAEL